VEGPKLVLDGVPGWAIKRGQVRIAGSLLFVEQWAQKPLAKVAGGSLGTIVVEENRVIGLIPVGAKAGSLAGTVEPLANVEARQSLVGQRDVQLVSPSGLGFRTKTAADQATASGEVHGGTVTGFNKAHVQPS
jgi:hypothetical protein